MKKMHRMFHFIRKSIRSNANHSFMLCSLFVLVNIPDGCDSTSNGRDGRWLNDIGNLLRHNNEKITISQGVSGTVVFTEGNCMPPVMDNASDPSRCMRYPVHRKIYIYELTQSSQAQETRGGFFRSVSTRKVAETTSDQEGFFELALPPGTYSVFIEEGGELYANLWDGQGNIQPVEVPEGETVFVRLDISYAATF